MNILFVHTSRHQTQPWRDASTRYRCYHLAEALRKLDVVADISAMSALKISGISRYDVVCVLRPKVSRLLDSLLEHCNRLGIHTVADVDDLIFDASHAAASPSVINQQASEAQVRTRFNHHLQALLGFNELIVATEPLARHWREHTGKHNVHVVPNGLSARWLATPVLQSTADNGAMQTITYLPGSSSHDKDFAQITDVLIEIFHKHTHVQLQIVGALNFDDRLFPSGRVARSPQVDYFKLPHIIANSLVTLAPLRPSPFSFAKSHVKFIESAAFGTPAICSPNEDICKHESGGLHLAYDDSDWFKALDETVTNPLNTEALESIQKSIRHIASADRSADALLRHWMSDDSTKLLQAA